MEAVDRERGREFTFLFVGAMGYYPNIDAAKHFCTEILPLLRDSAPGSFRLMIVGQRSENLRETVDEPEVSIVGTVDDVAPYYEQADAVVVPLRAGGGTRIKILEAFSHRRPVVSTRIGAEGLAVSDGFELLLADSPVEFARACAALMRKPELARGLGARAAEWVAKYHSPAVVHAIVRARRGLTQLRGPNGNQSG